ILLGLVLGALLGCGSSEPAPTGPAQGVGSDPGRNEEADKTVEATLDHSPAELLAKPRAELAALADEALVALLEQERKHYEGQRLSWALPTRRLPRAVPVGRQAVYSAGAGFSLPPYLAEGAKDTDLALHLARFGDAEAAHKLVDPSDADAVRRIDAL